MRGTLSSAVPDPNQPQRSVCSGGGRVVPSWPVNNTAAPADGRWVGLRTTMTSFGFDPPGKGLTTVADGVTIEVKLTVVRSG